MPKPKPRGIILCSGCRATCCSYYCENCLDRDAYDTYRSAYGSYLSGRLANRNTVVKMLLSLWLWPIDYKTRYSRWWCVDCAKALRSKGKVFYRSYFCDRCGKEIEASGG